MKCREVIEGLQKKWPDHFAMEWDNVGLLVGDKEQEVHHIFVALDVTDEVLMQAVACGADMIITHHPLIFSPVKKILADDFLGRRLIKLIKYDICYYAMHTNFDVAGMADLNAKDLRLQDAEVLEVTYSDENRTEGIGRIGQVPFEMKLHEFGVFVKESLGLEKIRVYGDPDAVIRKAAISSGSGKSMIRAGISSGADVLVTGDIDYHTGIDAVAQGLAIVDAGHYGTEMIFISHMEQALKEMYPDMIITAARIQQPFILC